MVFNDKLLFIHIPKCAGTSVENHLGLIKKNAGYGIIANKAQQHRTYEEYQKDLKQTMNNLTSFTIVRNPYDRCISEYYWNTQIGHKRGWSFDKFLITVARIVKNLNYNKPIKFFNDHHMHQYRYVLNNDGENKVDHIFRYKNMNEVIVFLQSYSNKPFPHDNISNKRIISVDNLTNSQKIRIENIYGADFDFFNYPRLSEPYKIDSQVTQPEKQPTRKKPQSDIKQKHIG